MSDQSLKKDAGKPRLDLIDPDAIEGLARVLGFGAEKYAPDGWRRGMQWSRVIAALLRHTFAIMRGEDIDSESGLPHVDHLGCCWMFLSNYQKHGIGKDDRRVVPASAPTVELTKPHAIGPGLDG